MDRSSSTSEYMRIRRHVLSIIYKNEGKAVQLPPISELTKLFNVSVPTVNKAMKALTDEGYVIGKRGIGSFTNPGFMDGLFSPIVKRMPVIGILFGDGMCVHLNSYSSSLLAKLLEEVIQLPAIIHQISLSSNDPQKVLKELRNEQLDGLIWHVPPEKFHPVCKELEAGGLPLVAGDCRIEGVTAVSFDNEDAAYRCGKILLSEGRRNIVFFPDTPPWNIQADGLRRAFREAGQSVNERLFIKKMPLLDGKLREMVSLGVPVDALFGHMMYQNEVENFLLELEPSSLRSCAIVNAGLSLPSPNAFRRLTYDYPFAGFAREITALLRAKLAGDKALVHKSLKLGIKNETPAVLMAKTDAAQQMESAHV